AARPPSATPAGHGELHVRRHERRGRAARARASRRRLVERVGVRCRKRRAVARARRDGRRTGGRADGGALHVLARPARAARRGRRLRRSLGRGRARALSGSTVAGGDRDGIGGGTITPVTADPEPVVTVVVPGFDVAEYAAEALDSLRRQTLRAWTAILVDDASTDATPDVFAEAAASDPRFRVVRHETRRGLGAARNTGLDLVETPFVGFLDADDALTERALERLVGTVTASGSDFALGAYVRL